MTIDKAIEILALYTMGSQALEPKDFEAAIKLGAEALKRLFNLRIYYVGATTDLLPGETKD